MSRSKKIENIGSVVAIAAGKGGVGKSSVTVCLALALQRLGFQVGILDADIYGPSLRKMLKLEKLPQESSSEKYPVSPGVASGMPCMSMAFLGGEPMIIRAPKANALIQQFIHQVDWGSLDFLLIDFPPGTGDIQLSILQETFVDAAILVTTPQEVATLDVKKAARMFEALEVPILGCLENMSCFRVGDQLLYPFGKEGGKRLAEDLGLPLLGEIPIDPVLAESLDKGLSIFEGGALSCPYFERLAQELKSRILALEESQGKSLKEFELIWENLS